MGTDAHRHSVSLSPPWGSHTPRGFFKEAWLKGVATDRIGAVEQRAVVQVARDEDAVDAPLTRELDGEVAFRLYDTYGFPLDLTQDMARERGMAVDVAGFDASMQQQKDTARAAGRFGGGFACFARILAGILFDEVFAVAGLSAHLCISGGGNQRIKENQ